METLDGLKLNRQITKLISVEKNRLRSPGRCQVNMLSRPSLHITNVLMLSITPFKATSILKILST